MQLLDSRLLIKLLRSISPDEITPETLHYILMSENNVVNCLMYGNNNTKQAYWPNPTLWQTHAQKLFSENKHIYTNIDAAGSIGLEKLEYCLSYKEAPKSLTDCFIRLLDEIYVAFYDEDIKLAKSEIVRILTELEAPTEDIDHIKTIDSLPRLSEFLVNRAKSKGGLKKQSTAKNKKGKASDKEDKEKVQDETNTKSEKGLGIVPCTYSQLKQKGLTAYTISERLLANDAALYGSDILGANAGTVEQWAAQIEAAPDNWFFFCEGTQIIGNWSITFLAPEEEVSVRKGIFAGDDFSLKSVNYPLTASDKEVVIYILNISLNSGYQTHDNWKALWNSFGKRVRQLNATGVTVKGIYSALFLDDHKVMFENMGFQYLVDNIVSGQVYYLDLSNPNLANFSWIIPNDESVTRNVNLDVQAYRQTTDYTCSAASTLAVLRYYGKEMNTTDTTLYKNINGYVGKIATALNSRLGGIYKWGTFCNLNDYENAIYTSLAQGSPVIARVRFQKGYFNYSSSGHYTTIVGLYKDSSGQTWVKIVDSFVDRYKANTYTTPSTGVVHVPLKELYKYGTYGGTSDIYLVFNP